MTLPRRAQPLEQLADADPAWVDHGDRRGVLLQFLCPIHVDHYLGIPVNPALDGQPPPEGEKAWQRSGGEAFDEVTLAPSIRILGGDDGCRWHGFIRGGRFETCEDAQ